jgi:hypothetical protein
MYNQPYLLVTEEKIFLIYWDYFYTEEEGLLLLVIINSKDSGYIYITLHLLVYNVNNYCL